MGQTLISLEFLIFLGTVFIAYYTLARRYQWQFLLVASYTFYALHSRWEYVLLLAAFTVINFIAVYFIGRSRQNPTKRLYLLLSLALNAAVLVIFKHAHLFGMRALFSSSAASQNGVSLTIPLGISYFTFKSIGYSIDTYRDKIRLEKNIFKFALFVSFFPEITSGPIDRGSALMPQIRVPKVF